MHLLYYPLLTERYLNKACIFRLWLLQSSGMSSRLPTPKRGLGTCTWDAGVRPNRASTLLLAYLWKFHFILPSPFPCCRRSSRLLSLGTSPMWSTIPRSVKHCKVPMKLPFQVILCAQFAGE
ncbi:hypothetical protein K402DRAFT_6366 [Aulographum hederae CBS 113979]|uniref:Uncharacterized protein n=1 Tax=Aulographum hederae CBS 113979 TaxID=1176131 RepID=A0A6G1HHM1_9PEZI|nr:hypothetical protein K402DRAFT_6366 [Aulographum hederae CBS 113979]